MSHKITYFVIDEEIKKLIIKGIKKAGTQNNLAKFLGYSTPTNIIYQFLSAPELKRTMPIEKVNKLKKYIKN